MTVEEFFEELYFLQLKQIILTGEFFSYSKPFLGEISKEKFEESMDVLNQLRRKIAHPKQSFSYQDLQTLIERVLAVCNGPASSKIVDYIKVENYKHAGEIPTTFYEEYDIPNNLPYEDFDLDGGFVGRQKEITDLKKLIYSNQDRIITITGAGGVGKTAIALKVAHDIILDPTNQFYAMMWFSAKENRLKDEGIMPLESGIRNETQFVEEISNILDPRTASAFKSSKASFEAYRNYLYEEFKKFRVLLVLDNLETIIGNEVIVQFLKDIPRPSQVLITSRRGLGEIERRFQLTNMQDKDAMHLFRLVARERNRTDLAKLSDTNIRNLCGKVKNYPLLIKWAIGQVCLGKDLDQSFSIILEGSSEIAQFVFRDVFSLLSRQSRVVLYSLIVYGNKPIRKQLLISISKLDESELEEAIMELQLSSLIISEVKEEGSSTVTVYYMLDLTKGFVETKLLEEQTILQMLQTNLYHLEDAIKDEEIVKRTYSQSLFSFGIKTDSDKIAFMYVKSAKNYFLNRDFTEAEKNFKEAVKASPNFSYALIEYSKFEFSRHNVPRALELAEKAVDSDVDNFHTWFTYGKMLRMSRKISDAISALKVAKQKNPEYLPIYNELGRAYSFNGEFDNAEKELNNALAEQKYPNIRHKTITLQYLSDNFRKEAEACRERRDFEGESKNLEKALTKVREALELNPQDYKLLNFRARVYIDIGITHSRSGKVKEGIEFFNMAKQPITIGNLTYYPQGRIVCEANYYLALYSLKSKIIPEEELEALIRKSYEICPEDVKWIEKFNILEKELHKNDKPTIKTQVQSGSIKYYNSVKKYGIIETSNRNIIFFPNSLRSFMNQSLLPNYVGKKVKFIIVEQNGRQIAREVEFVD